MDTNALIKLWNLTQDHPGTSGASAAAGILLGLYNGQRFPLDLTELRRLDEDYLSAAIAVIHSDASRTEHEVHEWLNQLTGRTDFGPRFQRLAYTHKMKGRCKRNQLEETAPKSIHITPNRRGTNREKLASQPATVA